MSNKILGWLETSDWEKCGEGRTVSYVNSYGNTETLQPPAYYRIKIPHGWLMKYGQPREEGSTSGLADCAEALVYVPFAENGSGWGLND
jgi:hypothetical protein